METVFLVCAVVGGSVLTFQFVMMLLGFGLDGVDLDIDVDFDTDVADSFSADGFDVGDVVDHGSTLTFQVLSFKSVVAGLTFFGLGGCAALEAGLRGLWPLSIAIVCGAVALYLIALIMNTLFKMKHDGTVRIRNAIDAVGAVYIPIPGGADGAGKVQVEVQGTLVEYDAITNQAEKLPTGARVVVVGIVDSKTLEVALANELTAAGES